MTKGTDLSIKQVAADLGIHANVLSRWCRKKERNGSQAFQGQGVPRDEELARVKRDRGFLKNPGVFFARDTMIAMR